MGNVIILNAKIKARANKLINIEKDIEEAKKRAAETEAAVDSAETDEDIDVLDEQMEKIQKEIKEKEEAKEKLEQEIVDLEKELEELNNKKPTSEKGERGMNKEKEIRSNLNNFIRTKGQTRDGVKIVDNGALVPVEILKPQIAPTLEVDLSKLVNVVKVNSASGKYPVVKKSGKKLTAVSELEKNPDLGKFSATPVDYSIETYRGHLAVSQEIIDDADFDILGLVAEDAELQVLNTKNEKIASILKTATAKAIVGLDGIKDVYNKEIPSVYDVSLVVSDSMFAALDKVKDKEGRYMLQVDITSPTGYKFGGKVIYRLPDTVIAGATGEMKGFIGDLKAFVTLFDRLQTTVKWVENDIYGQLLGIFTRFDARKTDSAAGFYVTYTDAV